MIWLGERVVADIRNAVYARVIRMDANFFEVTRTGEVLSRLTTDTTLVQSIAGAGLSIALRSILNLDWRPDYAAADEPADDGLYPAVHAGGDSPAGIDRTPAAATVRHGAGKNCGLQWLWRTRP